MEKGGGKKQLVTLNVVAETPTFNLLSEVASQLPTTCTLYVLQVKIEIRSNLGQPNKVDSQFPVSPGPNYSETTTHCRLREKKTNLNNFNPF